MSLSNMPHSLLLPTLIYKHTLSARERQDAMKIARIRGLKIRRLIIGHQVNDGRAGLLPATDHKSTPSVF